jgi:hypothetical protein
VKPWAWQVSPPKSSPSHTSVAENEPQVENSEQVSRTPLPHADRPQTGGTISGGMHVPLVPAAPVTGAVPP